MSFPGALDRIESELSGWPGIEVQPHRFGGRAFRLGRRQVGHVHGDSFVDIPFPTRIGRQLVAAGQAEPHHVLPDSGWVTVRLQRVEDLERSLELLRKSYELARDRRRSAAGRT